MSVQLFKTKNKARLWLLLLTAMMALSLNAAAQFSSGSTGADGPLDFSNVTPGSTVIFDPTKFTAAPHPAGQNIYNFTTINIPANVTVVLSSQNLTGPVFWLAQGDVRITGKLVLDGQSGSTTTADTALRIPALPGPGGYSGGVGGNNVSPGTAGNGPGGGRAGNFTIDNSAIGGTFTGGSATGPLVGGSGGGGAVCNSANFGPGGGAGGGALLIASSTSITINGVISANGGNADQSCNFGGPGSGGMIRLAANAISGNGSVSAAGGGGNCCRGATPGLIQFEAFQISGVGSNPAAQQSAPGALFLPTVPVSIQVVSVGGVALPTTPSGSFQTPDIVINSSSPVTVAIQTSGIPPGTVLTLFVFSENGSFQTVQTTALQGTLQSSTATASITFQPDLSLGFVKATWTQ